MSVFFLATACYRIAPLMSRWSKLCRLTEQTAMISFLCEKNFTRRRSYRITACPRPSILYKGSKISGKSSPAYMEGCHSLGTIYRSGLAGSIVTVARIEGKIFKTIKKAEAHGLELVRQCVDERWAEL